MILSSGVHGDESMKYSNELSINDQKLPEISGIDLAHRSDLWLWAINDSGNDPYLFGLDHRGRITEEFKLPFKNKDWEDLSTFRWKDEHWILIGDVGDNRAKRDVVKLYLFREPKKGDSVDKENVFRFKVSFKNGPRDVESIAVDAEKGWVYLLSKRDVNPILYRFPLDLGLADQNLTLTPIASFDHLPQPTELDLKERYGSHQSYPTAMDFDAQHRRMIILTYRDAYVFPWPEDESSRAFESFLTVKLPDQNVLKQRESICWNIEGTGIVVISEGSRSPIIEVSVSLLSPDIFLR